MGVALGLGCGPMDEPRGMTGAPESEDGGRPLSTGCTSDAECGAGLLCEGCPGATGKQCVPGCRTHGDCGENMVCYGNVVCSSCPCAPGWCVLSPCLDFDKDGYVSSSDPNLVCPGKQKGDCNDTDPSVHPGAVEFCSDWRDNDCNGKTDLQDSACDQCTATSRRCNTHYNCGLGTGTCERGCCVACPPLKQPTCKQSECLLPGGVNPLTSCHEPGVCGVCVSCGSEYVPVCAVNGATFNNDCYRQAAGVALLHRGACQYGEGASCSAFPTGGRAGCYGGGQYCRDTCPGCSTVDKRCTRVGVCVVDGDCPAGITGTPICPDGGIAGPMRCEDHACKVKC